MECKTNLQTFFQRWPLTVFSKKSELKKKYFRLFPREYSRLDDIKRNSLEGFTSPALFFYFECLVQTFLFFSWIE